MIGRTSVQVSKLAKRSIYTNAIGCIAGRNILNKIPINHRYVPLVSFRRSFVEGSTGGFQIPEEVRKLSDQEYHTTANTFMEKLIDQLEEISELHPTEIPDVELSQGVLTLVVPKFGTYVINKQPPNKQIWFASPVSGPNRYDLYQREWVSLRDNSKLLDQLNKELKDVITDININMN